MTAEEYIKIAFKGVGNIIRARRLVKIARQEEREKAISAFSKVLLKCGGSECKDACSTNCGTDCLIKKFTELLNK